MGSFRKHDQWRDDGEPDDTAAGSSDPRIDLDLGPTLWVSRRFLRNNSGRKRVLGSDFRTMQNQDSVVVSLSSTLKSVTFQEKNPQDTAGLGVVVVHLSRIWMLGMS